MGQARAACARRRLDALRMRIEGQAALVRLLIARGHGSGAAAARLELEALQTRFLVARAALRRPQRR